VYCIETLTDKKPLQARRTQFSATKATPCCLCCYLT